MKVTAVKARSNQKLLALEELFLVQTTANEATLLGFLFNAFDKGNHTIKVTDNDSGLECEVLIGREEEDAEST